MKKGVICDEVLRKLSRFNYSKSDMNFERRDVAFHINGGIAAAVIAHFNGMYNLGEKGVVDPGFLTTYEDVPVLFDAKRQLHYSNLPGLPIAMENNLGVYEISPMQDQYNTFFIQRAASAGLYSGLYASNMDGNTMARQEGKKVFYTNIKKGQCEIEPVLMLLVVDTFDLDMSDEIPMPANYQDFVVDATFQKMAQSLGIKTDVKTDGTPN
mgnify:CR=1 FL=1